MKLPRGAENSIKETPPDAQWMTAKERENHRYKKGDILLGADEKGWIGSGDDRHLITVAGSRAGKSSTVLKPNLMLWESSLLCIDPKGELASETAAHRAAMGQDVYILDPFGEVKGEAAKYRANFNPLDELKNASPADVIDDAALVAEAIIANDGRKQDHWTLGAKNLIRGLCLWSLHKTPQEASLVDVREMITSPMGDDDKTPDGSRVWLSTQLKLMMENDEIFNGVVSGVGGTMYGKPTGERASIVSTAVEQTSFLDSTPMQEHLTDTDLPSLRVLKQKPTTIYLVLPASRMATHFRWFRLILTLALSALEREPMALPAPVLFVLEEFPQLGYMRQLESAMGLMAGYGCKLHTVLQDLSQIKSLYQNSWETFIGNTGVVQFFGNTDASTLEYASRALGTRQITQRQATNATPSQRQGGANDYHDKHNTTPLLAPFEIAKYCARHTGKQIIIFAGEAPAWIDRITHSEVEDMQKCKTEK